MLLTVEKPLRITLKLESGGDPIAGRLYANERRERRFYGWLQFAAALEAACKEGSASTGMGAAGPWAEDET